MDPDPENQISGPLRLEKISTAGAEMEKNGRLFAKYIKLAFSIDAAY